MKKEAVISGIQNYLDHQDEVVFAFIFGSFVKSETFRDVDVAIYTKVKLNLVQFGAIQSGLTECIRQDIDLVSLNGLPSKNPAFAYEIVTQGKLLFYTDKEKFTAYKQKALLYFFDTANLRKKVKRAFAKRMELDKFGERNYV